MGMFTYSVPNLFFCNHLNTTIFPASRDVNILKKYDENYWTHFTKFFNLKNIQEQFEFIDEDGSVQGMYSWAHPGYSRLQKLESVAHFIEKRYQEKSANKESLQNFIRELKTNSGSGIDSFKLKLISNIYVKTHNLPRRLSPTTVRVYLKEIFLVVFVKYSGEESQASREVIALINKSSFKNLRSCVDPEKEILTFDDIDAFLRS